MAKKKQKDEHLGLVEQDTQYSFYHFWKSFTEKDENWQENDGGSFLKWGTRKDLRGLCRVCMHYNKNRGNPLNSVTVNDLVRYISRRDKTFASRSSKYLHPKYQEMLKMTAKEWVDRVLDGNKTLRALLGIKA